MKTNLVILALASLAISACSTPPKPTVAPPPPHVVEAPAPVVETHVISAAELEAQKLAAQLEEMRNKSVYFDFNKFAVKKEYRDLIMERAELLKAHGNVTVTLEGNADERGSSEYNLALGNKRANAVRSALKLIGVPDSQIKTTSMGEEHPRLACHAEKCWKENRRVDFVGKQGS